MPAPTITIDNPNPKRGDTIKATVVYDPLTVNLTATAPNGESTTVPVSFKVALSADAQITLTRVSDDGHTAVFTGVF
jgi:hypothetical protein